MSASSFPGPRRIPAWLVPILLLSLYEPGLAADDWYGSFTFTEKRRGDFAGCTERDQEKRDGEYHEKGLGGMILRYCAGAFHIEKVAFRETAWGTESQSGPRKWCSMGPMASSECRALYRAELDKSKPPAGSVTIGFMPFNLGGFVTGFGSIPVVMATNEFGSGYVGCGDEIRTWSTVTTPFSLDGVPEDRIKEWEERFKEVAEANARTLSPVPGSRPAGSHIERLDASQSKSSVIAGQKELLHETTKDWELFGSCGVDAYEKVDVKEFDHTVVARWFFTNSACDFVRNELSDAVQIKNAYRTLREEGQKLGLTGAEFNDYVKKKIEDSAGMYLSPMGTGADSCNWVPGEESDQKAELNEQQIKDRYYSCVPAGTQTVLFDADRNHERAHENTCRSMNVPPWDGSSPSPYSQYMSSVENYIADEVKAYNAKIRTLCGYLSVHCDPLPAACSDPELSAASRAEEPLLAARFRR